MERLFLHTLVKYGNSDRYPWHMPGHKRQMNLAEHMESLKLGAGYDITEVPGLDNLLVPEGVLADSMAQLPEVYGSYRSYYLVNGSSCGLLTAISAVCRRGDTLIMGRNCHRSIYHAVALLGLQPVYIYPENLDMCAVSGPISKEALQSALRLHPEAKAVIFPSPTYEGILSDIAEISEIVHQAGAYLIVDEAHGAHLEFCDSGPASAVRCGADLVVESLHKTLPCYNQCAILHIGRGRRTENEKLQEQIEHYLSVYQTSSPSYLLVANMEDSIVAMDEWRTSYVPEYWERLQRFRRKWETMTELHLLTREEVLACGAYEYDITKLVFYIPEKHSGITGEQLARWLESVCGMVMEMASLRYVLAMTSVADSEEAFERLDKALSKLDCIMKYEPDKIGNPIRVQNSMAAKGLVHAGRKTIAGEMVLPPGEAWNQETVLISLQEAAGRIAGEYVAVYPPGIPQLVPGEAITSEQVDYLQQCIEHGLYLHGIVKRGEDACIRVLQMQEARADE